MRIKCFFYLQLFINIIFCAWTLNDQIQCQCDKLVNKFDCLENQCYWNKTLESCNIYCEIYKSQLDCLTNNKCYWNNENDQCDLFIDCQNLIGNNEQECTSQNNQCTWINGNNCQQNQIPCSSLANNCLGSLGSDGYCVNQTSTNCIVSPSCYAFVDESYCPDEACTWNSNTDKCVPYLCYQLQNELECDYVYLWPDLLTIQPCYWNGQQCIEAQDSSVYSNQFDCSRSTKQTYYWTSQNTCQSCSNNILFIFILIINMIF